MDDLNNDEETSKPTNESQEIMNAMINEITSKVDEINQTVNNHTEYIETLSETVIQHDTRLTITENKSSEIEIRMQANSNFIAENFENMKEFLKTLNDKAHIKGAKSIDNHAKEIRHESSFNVHDQISYPSTTGKPTVQQEKEICAVKNNKPSSSKINTLQERLNEIRAGRR